MLSKNVNLGILGSTKHYMNIKRLDKEGEESYGKRLKKSKSDFRGNRRLFGKPTRPNRNFYEFNNEIMEEDESLREIDEPETFGQHERGRSFNHSRQFKTMDGGRVF